VATAHLLSEMRYFHLSRLWTREEKMAVVSTVCAVRATAKNFCSPPTHVPKERVFSS